MNNNSNAKIQHNIVANDLNKLLKCYILTKRTGYKKMGSAFNLAKLLIVAGDITIKQASSFTVHPMEKNTISAKDIGKMKEMVNDRYDSLYRKIRKLFMKRKIYSSDDIAILNEWISLMKNYIDNKEVIQCAEKILECSLEIEHKKLENLTTLLLNNLINYEKREIVMPILQNNRINIITQDDLLELMLANTPPELKECIVAEYIYDYFPKFVIIKDDIEVLPFQYTIGNYEVDLLVTIMKTSSVNGFEFTVGITDWQEKSNLYSTEFEKVPKNSLAKYLEDMFQEKNIDFINYPIIGKIRDILEECE